jgi:outer membrane protein assembly factor BamB
MGKVVVCTVCSTKNFSLSKFCVNCRARIDLIQPIPKAEAELILRNIDRSHKRRKFKRFGIYAAIATAVFIIVLSPSFYSSILDLFTPYKKEIFINSTKINSNSNWNMYQKDSLNSGFSNYNFNPSGRILWEFKTNSGFIKSSPAIVEGMVYLSTGDQSDRRIVGIDTESGQVSWERSVDPPAETSPAISGNALYITLRDGTIMSLDRVTGNLLWLHKAGSPIFSSPTFYQGVLYVTTHEEKLLALEALSGEVLWSRDVGSSVASVPAVNDVVVAFNSNSNYVHILDSKTGQKRLKYPTGYVSGSVAISQNLLFVSDWTGRVQAINWTKIEHPFERQFRTFKLNLYVWGLIDSFPQWTGFTWIFERLDETFQSTPVVTEDAVLVTSSSGKVYKLNAANGRLIWMFDTGAEISQPVVASKDTVIVGDSKGDLFRIDILTGEGEKFLNVDGSISSPPVISDKRLFITTNEGSLYSIE